MYMRTSFRDAKMCKIGKGCVFGHAWAQILKRRGQKIKKKAYKIMYLGFIFIPAKYGLRMCFERPIMKMI